MNIYDNDFFISVDDKFLRILDKKEREREDVSFYREKYEKLFENYINKMIR